MVDEYLFNIIVIIVITSWPYFGVKLRKKLPNVTLM